MQQVFVGDTFHTFSLRMQGKKREGQNMNVVIYGQLLTSMRVSKSWWIRRTESSNAVQLRPGKPSCTFSSAQPKSHV